jgi:hypothetical protein
MANTSLKSGLAALAVAGVAITLLIQHQSQTKLAEENAALRQQLAQVQALNESLSNLVVQTKTPEAPPAAPSDELLRLRGELALLRQQTNELAQLQRQNQRLLSQAAEQSQSTNQISAEDRFVLQQTHVVDAMTAVLTAIKEYAAKHGQYPDNLQELIASGVLTNSSFAGDLGLDDFEFSKSDATDQLGNRNILRARTLLQRPGGAFLMVSGGINGAGNVHTEIRNWNPQ